MTIKKRYRIKAPVADVWDCLVNPEKISQWGGGPAEMSDEAGASFKLWGGDIHGKNTEVIAEQQLTQEWLYSSWEQPSIVTFHLSHDGTETQIDILHDFIPDADVKEIEDGWDDYYMGAIKKYLEGTEDEQFVSSHLAETP